MSLRGMKVFKKLFPLKRGDYIRYRKKKTKDRWKYGTICFTGFKGCYIRKSTGGSLILYFASYKILKVTRRKAHE